jgi:hypothetical protein
VTVVQVHPDAASMQKHLGIIGDRAAQAYDETLDATVAIQVYGPVDPQMLETMRAQTGEGVSLSVATEHLGGLRDADEGAAASDGPGHMPGTAQLR